MESFREDFDNRSGEILAYLDLLRFIESAGAEIVSSDKNDKFSITAEARKTLKGTVYILLYNLIESSMREAICFIHDTIYYRNIAFDDLKDTLKKEILKRLKHDSVNVEKLIVSLTKGISCGISIGTFNKQKLFSGNIDKDEIKDKSAVYGFSISTDYKHTKHGENLTLVKQHRNDLAHGNVSFSEIGKNVSYQDLENVSLEIIAYLDGVTKNIEQYVNTNGYLAP
ncbi:MAE_28990/MAE_18760 family HEPN-like nuclease [Prodigiosinella aquatilis]|nr:MAE_28990/MAE_18760 family HEPN-like nuclease [Prodigiosinella sp. LS101]WJV52933.1 MAE_28990/MAE_18760 family HEPN-like nuclease [Prodigiosinella sp. LS101]WJV57288.1 MAE_28990/MAE_18760 family HEPN-like nuclease [Pectobacteriaceae bacterium C111]